MRLRCSGWGLGRPRPKRRAHQFDRKVSAITESYRALRAALMVSRAGEPPRVTLFIENALPSRARRQPRQPAFLLLSDGQRARFVDRRRLHAALADHEMLNMPNTAGLTEVLSGLLAAEKAISATAFPRLWLLCSGSVPPSPNELRSARRNNALDELRRAYDYIVVDATPTMTLSDALPLSTIVARLRPRRGRCQDAKTGSASDMFSADSCWSQDFGCSS